MLSFLKFANEIFFALVDLLQVRPRATVRFKCSASFYLLDKAGAHSRSVVECITVSFTANVLVIQGTEIDELVCSRVISERGDSARLNMLVQGT